MGGTITGSLSSGSSQGSGVAWTTPENIALSDGNYATAALSAGSPTSQLLVGLLGSIFAALGDDDIPTLVEVLYEAADTALSISEITDIFAWDGSATQGDDQSDGENLNDTDTVHTKGSGLWNWWTKDRLKTGTNGFAFRFARVNGSPTVRVDHLQARVTYITPTVAVNGSITESANESDIVTGGKTVTLSLTDATWAAAGAAFEAERQGIIDGLQCTTSQTNGWNNEVVPSIPVGNVARTSDTVVTITLPAIASYAIDSDELCRAVVPASAQSSGSQLVGTPTWVISAISAEGDDDLLLLGVG